MQKKRIHLVCNAHLDPVWLWHWEDGLTEALSTFRVAADFCEQHRGFVFNHNEALLYRWVEEFEPALFKRIRKLVRQGRWHIAGGTYLQPDVNNTSGESHIRHYLVGRRYFTKKFGLYPETAYNFDPFGHAEGLPHILQGCGMAHYIFCRPDYGTYDLPLGAFRWQDRSGAQVIARRSDDHYLTNGRIVEQLDRFLVHYADEPETMILWGIGNHGGGPSQDEYAKLKRYIAEHPDCKWIESTTDRFFRNRLSHGDALPAVSGEIENSFPGCYTSMSRVKRAHRGSESLMASSERLAALAWWWGCASYPSKDLEVAWKDILFAEFHDILPGSGTPTVERDSLQLLAHAQEILRRQQARSLLSVLSQDASAKGGEVPVFVANPHGFPAEAQVEFELNLDDNASAIRHPEIHLSLNGRPVPCQRLQAEASCAGNWRVRLAAHINLRPWEIHRLDESFVNDRPQTDRLPKVNRTNLEFRNRHFHLRINPRTGLVDHLALPGGKTSLLRKGALAPVCFRDLDHSWTCGDPDKLKDHRVGTLAPGWDRPSDRFRLATRKETAALSPPAQDKWQNRKATAARPIRITEHGPLRTVVEALLVCGPSAVVRQYHIGHSDGSFEIRDRVLNNHRDTMLKLMLPLNLKIENSISEALYSAVVRKPSGCHEDRTNQRWVAVRGKQQNRPVYLAVLNTGSGAHSLTQDELALNVLRAPAYSSFNLNPNDEKLNNRFIPRQDQGEHELRFAFHIGRRFNETEISRAAALLNVPPVWQVYYPQPVKADPKRRASLTDTVVVNDNSVQIVALKKSEDGDDLIVRLQNTASRTRNIQVRVKPYRQAIRTAIDKYGLLTLAIRKGSGKLQWRRVNLVEQEIP